MTAPTDSHALRLLTARKLDPSPSNLAYARRRVLAAGRLAALGAHMVPGVLRVSSVEHGEADAMSPGSMMAEVWLDAPRHEWQRRAADLLQLQDIAAGQGLRLTLAVYRATRWDRWRERLAWMVAR